MKSLLIAISKRVGIGVFISLMGILASLLAHSWVIEIDWFSLIGMAIIAIGGFMIMGGNKLGTGSNRIFGWDGSADYHGRQASMGFALSMFLIGLPVVLISVFTYFIIR